MDSCNPCPTLFNPASYKYRPLKKNHIRVLRLLPPPSGERRGPSSDSEPPLKCEILHIPLNGANPYEALSYVWGSDVLTRTITVANSKRHFRTEIIPITESLWVALTHLWKESTSRDLWVDQLCINQNDKAEKGIQVNCMGEIYSQATTTVIWLGPQGGKDAILLNQLFMKLSFASGDERDARGVLSMDQNVLVGMMGTSSKQEREDRMIHTYRRLLERFLALPWFGRAWVYQEATLARRVIVVWGKIILPFDFITGLVFSVYGLAKSSQDDRKWHKRIKNTKGFAPLRAIYHDRTAHRDGKLDFLHVLWYARKHLSAKDDRDYVYAFRGVNKHRDGVQSQADTRIQDEMVPDYQGSNVSDVYTKLAITVIHTTRTLDILHYIIPTNANEPADSANAKGDSNGTGQLPKPAALPSWVPDWSNRNFKCGGPIFDPQLPWPTSACAGKLWTPGPSPSREQLRVTGYIISRIGSIINHSFEHTYFSSTLKKALGLDNLVAKLKRKAARLAPPPDSAMPEWCSGHKIRETALRTVLIGGAFTLTHRIEHPIRALLGAYDNEESVLADPDVSDEEEEGNILSSQIKRLRSGKKREETKLLHYLRQSGEMATGKRVFLTDELDIGLGYATVKKGDVVCILMGCKAPCVLRRSEGLEQGRYRFVGLCYLDGWMDGSGWDIRARAGERGEREFWLA